MYMSISNILFKWHEFRAKCERPPVTNDPDFKAKGDDLYSWYVSLSLCIDREPISNWLESWRTCFVTLCVCVCTVYVRVLHSSCIIKLVSCVWQVCLRVWHSSEKSPRLITCPPPLSLSLYGNLVSNPEAFFFFVFTSPFFLSFYIIFYFFVLQHFRVRENERFEYTAFVSHNPIVWYSIKRISLKKKKNSLVFNAAFNGFSGNVEPSKTLYTEINDKTDGREN